MSLIQWSNELSVGIDSIDKQHQKLVSLINTLNDAKRQSNSHDVLSHTFKELAQYTQDHFAYEEQLLSKHGYEESVEHKRQHDELTVQIVELKDKFNHYQDDSLTDEVMEFLKRWLTFHIMTTDKAYSEFLLAKGVN